ncbi:class A beta-lactamase-related serine hydrolase [Marinilongibacter aquaticus]|uniref:class A beta-lactamase-related serine hydrolase n=1 Tax=Marinilongibacter aquaticus TaxID=2975157 RepID=UPI0021BDB3A6|nr:class A beta-lactamase-related serine hydrolase [Marinilongibacter aquaticus]UBM57372.1 class A beta-lactamase-related serine hydrolase [Marinilongibacter aquaticus]
MKKAEEYKIQIVYTPIDENGRFQKTQFFNYQPDSYFYPASTVKLPVALFALEKLKTLGIDRKAEYWSVSEIDSYPGIAKSEGKSVESLIEDILLVSSNDAYNRLFDFLGTEEIHNKFEDKGFSKSRINHRLSIRLSPEENRSFPEVHLGNYKQAAFKNALRYTADKPIYLGTQHYHKGKLVAEPMDFSAKNRFELLDQHYLLMSLFFPEQTDMNSHFDLRPDDLEFVKNTMAEVPRHHGYDPEEISDGQSKFLLFGDSKEQIPDYLKIYNKIGDAYGFMIDNAYVHDSKNNIRFILSAVIYCNANQTLNDDNYEYETLGLPFMGLLGRQILAHQIEEKH